MCCDFNQQQWFRYYIFMPNYTAPARLNCRVESRRRRVLNSQLVGNCLGSRRIWTNVPTQLNSPTNCEFNTHRRRDATRQLSRVDVGSVSHLRVVHDRFGRKVECWEFMQSSCLHNWKLGHDCRRVSTHAPLDRTQPDSSCSFFLNLSTKSVGSLVSRELVNTHATRRIGA